MRKLYLLLSRLTPKELAKFQCFLLSPYFNQDRLFIDLLDSLTPYHPHFEILDAKVLFKNTFITDKNVNEKFSQLCRLVEQFMAQEQLQSKPGLLLNSKLRAAQYYDLPQWFSNLANSAYENIKNKFILSNQKALHLWSVIQITQTYPKAARLKSSTWIEDDLKLIDQIYICNKLKYYCNALSRNVTLKKINPLDIPESLIQNAQNFSSHPLISLLQNLLHQWQHPEENLFGNIYNHFIFIYNELDEGDQLFFLLQLINLANVKVNHGNTNYRHTIFELYQLGIQTNLLQNQGYITDLTFLNIVQIAALTQNYDWAKAFLHSNHQLLPGGKTHLAYKLSQGILSFNQGKIEKTIHLLSEVNTKDINYKIRIRSILVRCLLELLFSGTDHYMSLRDAVEAFNKFLSRNQKLSTTRKQGYKNLNKAILKIADCWLYEWQRPKSKEKIRQWINDQKPIIAKEWLLRKLEQEKPPRKIKAAFPF